MIYLYVKTHNVTGLKYLGKTTKDPYSYKGSGKYWVRHIKKYGYDVTTDVVFQTDDPLVFKTFSVQYSVEHDIVNSNEWANLMLETGSGGDNPSSRTPAAIAKARDTRIRNNKPRKPWSDETNRKRSETHTGMKRSAESIAKRIATMKARGIVCSEEHKRKISEALKGRKNTFTEEHIQHLRCHINNSTQVTCPYCNKTGQLTNMKRWHFDKCKHNPDRTVTPPKYLKCSVCGLEAEQTPNFFKYHNTNCASSRP
jgi:hypothetical protein